MESTIASQDDHLPASLLIGAKGAGIGGNWLLVRESLRWGCQFHPGDQTSGSPFGYPIDIPLEEQCPAEFFSAWLSTVGKVLLCFNQLAEMQLREESGIVEALLPGAIDAFAGLLRRIPGVEQLRALRTDTGFATWVVVNNASRKAEYSIFDAEMALMTQFPNVVIDFHVVDRRGRELSSVATFDREAIIVPLG
jgi:hypothetical protein